MFGHSCYLIFSLVKYVALLSICNRLWDKLYVLFAKIKFYNFSNWFVCFPQWLEWSPNNIWWMETREGHSFRWCLVSSWWCWIPIFFLKMITTNSWPLLNHSLNLIGDVLFEEEIKVNMRVPFKITQFIYL